MAVYFKDVSPVVEYLLCPIAKCPVVFSKFGPMITNRPCSSEWVIFSVKRTIPSLVLYAEGHEVPKLLTQKHLHSLKYQIPHSSFSLSELDFFNFSFVSIKSSFEEIPLSTFYYLC